MRNEDVDYWADQYLALPEEERNEISFRDWLNREGNGNRELLVKIRLARQKEHQA
jgi:hypothetical protein